MPQVHRKVEAEALYYTPHCNLVQEKPWLHEAFFPEGPEKNEDFWSGHLERK
jgi:hypothetical protein